MDQIKTCFNGVKFFSFFLKLDGGKFSVVENDHQFSKNITLSKFGEFASMCLTDSVPRVSSCQHPHPSHLPGPVSVILTNIRLSIWANSSSNMEKYLITI